MTTVLAYLQDDATSPFDHWVDQLDAVAAVMVQKALTKIEQGQLGNTKPVGKGVFEYRIDFGPGYRIYFGKDGPEIVILLGGGSKKGQDRDIFLAHDRWADYKRRKNQS